MSDISVKGYHGTTQKNKDSILENGFHQVQPSDLLLSSGRIPNDLGAGTYFFCDNPDLESEGFSMAYEYTKKYKNSVLERQKSVVSVIEVEVKCKEEHILDLDEKDNHKSFIKARQKFEYQADQLLKRAKDDGARQRDNRDGIFIEMLIKKINADIKVVSKRTYTPLKQKVSNFENGHELCVRDNTIIDIVMPKEMGG